MPIGFGRTAQLARVAAGDSGKMNGARQ